MRDVKRNHRNHFHGEISRKSMSRLSKATDARPWFDNHRSIRKGSLILGIFLIIIMLGVALYESPLFHSYVYGPHPNNNDPIINLWRDYNPNQDLSEWNSRPAVFTAYDGTSPQSIKMIGTTTTDI